MHTLAIVGPTAVGKTELSLGLARATNGEIINADSMQLYREMDIGTAKLTISERSGIAHHLFDVLDIGETASASDYQKRSRAVIVQIIQREGTPILVGGSGLFINACLDDFEFPTQDEAIRAALEVELAEIGALSMYEKLQALAPHAAANILPTNGRRIVRALEVLQITGEAPQTQLSELREVVPAIRIGLTRTRADLDSRINLRVEQMWETGLVDEVRTLMDAGLARARTASAAIGYRQTMDYINGEISSEQAKDQIKASTRRYVRRQESWFARDKRITWFNADTPRLLEEVLIHIEQTKATSPNSTG